MLTIFLSLILTSCPQPTAQNGQTLGTSRVWAKGKRLVSRSAARRSSPRPKRPPRAAVLGMKVFRATRVLPGSTPEESPPVGRGFPPRRGRPTVHQDRRPTSAGRAGPTLLSPPRFFSC